MRQQTVDMRPTNNQTIIYGKGYLQLPLLSHAGVFHLFGTRLLDKKQLQKDYAPILLHQVHGNRIVQVLAEGSLKKREGDGLMTKRTNHFIAISTADCVPILLFDPVKKVVLALHAGWQGSLRNIAGTGVRNMALNYGSNPNNLIAGIGPSIGACCFEVDMDVASVVEKEVSHVKDVLHAKGNRKWRLDLAKLNHLQLVDAGLLPQQIQSAGLCTACLPELFRSFRRDKKIVDNMVSGIMLL